MILLSLSNHPVDIMNLKQSLQILELISGFKVNWRKLDIVGTNVEDSILFSFANIHRCKIDEWPLKYLGLSLGGKPHLGKFWDPIVEEVEKRLALWKNHTSLRVVGSLSLR